MWDGQLCSWCWQYIIRQLSNWENGFLNDEQIKKFYKETIKMDWPTNRYSYNLKRFRNAALSIVYRRHITLA